MHVLHNEARHFGLLRAAQLLLLWAAVKKKKITKSPKKIVLSKEKVRDLTKVEQDRLRDVAGGLFAISDGCTKSTI